MRELVREICRAKDIEIVKGHVGKNHVHLFVSVPPYLSVSRVMQEEDQSQVADGVRASASAILGEAFVGQRILCSEQRQCDGRSDSAIHRHPRAGTFPVRRGFQD